MQTVPRLGGSLERPSVHTRHEQTFGASLRRWGWTGCVDVSSMSVAGEVEAVGPLPGLPSW